jgi:DNA-binding LacI/PurR family transcriptional regulator
MREVAEAAGVSVTTVSYVLTERPDVAISASTRDRVQSAARRLNYRYNAHAADLRRGATRIVAIQIYSLEVSILARKVAALEGELRKAGYYPFLCHASDPEAEQAFFKECVSRRVRGIVLTAPPHPESYAPLRRLMAEGAVVVASEPIPDLLPPYVTVDRGGGAETAVRHLVTLGHRRIGAVIGFTARAREEFRAGYGRGLVGARIPFDPELVLAIEPDTPGYAAGARAAEWLMELAVPPTAVVTTDDEVAIGALRSLQQRGLRVPDDVALVGCDDIPAATYADIPLTTLAHPAEEVGSRLAQWLLEGIADPEQIAGRRVALPLRLVIRDSCGARRRQAAGPNGALTPE